MPDMRPMIPKNVLLVCLMILGIPLFALGHGGGLDGYGCHHNRKHGGYHCHRGLLAGQHFSSKASMLQELRAQRKKPVEPPGEKSIRVCVKEEGTDRIVCGEVVEPTS